MRIAFTHNLQRSSREEEAEFDTPATVAFVSRTLQQLGHEVEPIDVSQPLARTLARLQSFAPALVFNTAEGQHGRGREAFYPGLFEQLGLPYTGSDAYVCTLTLDKRLSKQVVAAFGVPTPKWSFVERVEELDALTLRYPLIVKPNFEGSSKGITQDSVVGSARALRARVKALLQQYPDGLLVEEFISGRDVVVPFIEGTSPKTGGVLVAAEYDYPVGRGGHRIYDFSLKQLHSDQVHVRVPAKLSPGQQRELQTLSRRAFAALGIRDLGRLDFRLSEDGKLYFIEANALPSLEPGAAIYESARRAGLQTPRALLGAVVSSALRRRGLKPASARASSKGLVVGLTYNLKRIKPQADGARDDEAEFDSRETIDALRAAIESHGHRVVELEATAELPLQLGGSRVDVVFNLAEGQGGRGREAQVPALLELCNIPYTGSDATALCLCLDKGLAKRVVSGAGVHTAGSVEMTTGKEALPSGLSFPLLVKPLWEGSSKGVLPSSVVHDERALRKRVRAMVERYQQPALVEQYLPGREFTIALLGGTRPRVLPPMEIVFTEQAGKFPVYAIEHKLSWVEAVRYQVPAKITAALARKLEQAALAAFVALGCRDVARVDLRLDADGEPCFIECNPLPGLTPAWSDLCLIATAAGIDYPTLVGQILAPAIRRFKARRPGPRRARTA